MSAYRAAETFTFVSLQEEFPSVAGVSETVVLVTGIVSKAPAVGDLVLLVLLEEKGTASCWSIALALGQTWRDIPPKKIPLPFLHSLLSLNCQFGEEVQAEEFCCWFLFGVCVQTSWFGSAWLYCSHFYRAVSGVLGTGTEDIRWVYGCWEWWQKLQAWERGRACAQLLGLGCLADVTALCGYMASPKVSFGVFVYWGLSLCSMCCWLT